MRTFIRTIVDTTLVISDLCDAGGFALERLGASCGFAAHGCDF
jgi:hypothetical protein